MNGKTERALRTFALLYARFDQVISDVVIVVKDFDKEFARMLDEMEKVKEAQRSVEIIAQTVHDSREHYHRLASDFDEVEGAANEWLGCMHKLICGDDHDDKRKCRVAQETGARKSRTIQRGSSH